ncbi:hypothetical protein CMO89_02930 [Candidatus Woesearchaeota archaeon]|nr:hypothetical protein [Candidatus Woesearchaeota archaeon]|tara:strand:- start:2017 stop:2268 length:252 start_codon:yes stop_codon:yes gene_type:complete
MKNLSKELKFGFLDKIKLYSTIAGYGLKSLFGGYRPKKSHLALLGILAAGAAFSQEDDYQTRIQQELGYRYMLFLMILVIKQH